MEKVCVICGKPFDAKRKHAKYCSEACKYRSRYPRSREQKLIIAEQDAERAITLFKSGKSVSETAKIIQRSTTWVYKALKSSGIDPKSRLTKDQAIVKKWREKGLCCSEIVDATGFSPKKIGVIAIAIGMPFSEEEKKRSYKIAFVKSCKTRGYDIASLEQKANNYIATNCPGWTYISGFINDDGYMKLRCEKCGEIIERASQTVRKNNDFACPVCEIRRREKLKEEKEEQKRAKAKEKQRIFWSQDFKQITFKFRECKNCGTFFIGKNKCYCSEECRKKALNKAHDHRILRAPRIDGGITLAKLFKRDNGKCWLCGEPCDYGDYNVDENGYFITGGKYPSIDHVYPLARGGSHTWENVRLAHHYCNTLKSDKVVC